MAETSSTPAPTSDAPMKEQSVSVKKPKAPLPTLNDWVDLCEAYERQLESKPKLSHREFLRSESTNSGSLFCEKNKNRFGKEWRKYKKGELERSNRTRQRKRKFVAIEEKLIQYIDARAANYGDDDNNGGVSYAFLKQKCNEWAYEMQIPDFVPCSNGWLSGTMKRYGRRANGEQPNYQNVTAANRQLQNPTKKRKADFQVWPDAVFDNETEDPFLDLHFAVKYSDEEELNRCLNSSNDLEARLSQTDSKGRTALDLASLTGQLKFVAILEEKGAMHKHGNRALMRVKAKKRSEHVDKYKRLIFDSVE